MGEFGVSSIRHSLIIFSFLSNKKCSDSHSLHAFNMAGPFLRFFS